MNTFQIPAQVGDRVTWDGRTQYGTITEIYPDRTARVQHDSGSVLNIPTNALTLVASVAPTAPLLPRKKHTARNVVMIAVVGVVGLLFIAGLAGGNEVDTTTPPVTTTQPAPKADPAPAPVEDAPSVTDLEESSGVTCDSGWQEQTTAGAEMAVCADADGTMYAVVDVSGTTYPASTLAGIYKDQGNFAGSYALVGDTWLMILPTRSLAKEIKAETGGTIEQL